ncbi:MarR family transcriptional regulator [Leucobacter sp. CSA1]|uniref:MarR family transcriptional regulator n=1 Tax=Leucobacter chromiisoli TaxID=2796471 RepID=A0A934UU66_9MICO|nr:MarR family transcriptional regulator [Leucobacter chromiisoli]MBK0417647.1 MarR family transcriptional regulator [Leucobacter chromiisoli]
MHAHEARGSAVDGDEAAAPSAGIAPEEEAISDIIAEFSQVFAFARTRWTRYAEEVHPDLRGVGMMVLQTIRRRGPITATELSHLLDMDKAVVSRQVAKLRQLDLIDAEPSAEDRRVVLLTTSTAAQGTLDGLHAQTAHAYHERFEGWSVEDLEALRAALRRFNRSAGSGPEGPATRCAREQEPR